jgi:hypothetical protein
MHLFCVKCGGELRHFNEGYKCKKCGKEYSPAKCNDKEEKIL